jgi:hypothetical protein
MPCEIIEKESGRFTIRISGLLKKAELAQAEQAAVMDMKSGGKIRFLALIEDFQGWDSKDDWGDVSFQWRYDDQIEKIAIVCESKWHDLTEAFVGKGLRPIDIRHFEPAQVALAKAWIK